MWLWGADGATEAAAVYSCSGCSISSCPQPLGGGPRRDPRTELLVSEEVT